MIDSKNTHFDLRSNDETIPMNVTTVTIHPSVTRIRAQAFKKRSQLTSIEIPNTITEIKGHAFCDCYQLQYVKIPDSVQRIGYGAFSGCSELTSIKIPESVTIIGGFVFQGCSKLTSVNVPESITDIGHCIFQGCFKLALIRISDKTRIGHTSFSRCQALEKRLVNGYNYNTDINTWLRQRFLNLPLHQAFYNATSVMTIQTLMNLIQRNKSILTETDAMGMTPLHILCGNPNATTEMVKIVKSAQPKAALVKTVTGQTPLMMFFSVRNNQDYYDTNGQLLPLIKLLEKGLECDALEVILEFNGTWLDSEQGNTDEMSGLLPFMLASTLSQCRLDLVFKLARMRPDLLHNCWNNNYMLTVSLAQCRLDNVHTSHVMPHTKWEEDNTTMFNRAKGVVCSNTAKRRKLG